MSTQNLWPETAEPLDPLFVDLLSDETRALIAMLKHEIGLRWMSFPLQLQIERIEEMLGDRGTMSVEPS